MNFQIAMRRTLFVAFLLLSFSGCADPEAQEPTQSHPIVTVGDRPDESYGNVETGPAVGPDMNATTQAPPRLVPGEWWRVQFDSYLSTETVEVVRVVAHADEDGYIVGMPHEGWLKEAISFHSPAFGDVNLDLSYNTHNARFEPVRFPMATGDTWETSFATTPMQAEVIEATDDMATVHFTPISEAQATDPLFALLGFAGGGEMELVYDAKQHEVVSMTSDIGTWRVVEHGYGYEGWVTVPRGEDTVIDYGTFGPASDGHSPLPQTIEVDGGFNRLTMMHVVGSADNVPGTFRIRDMDPEGAEFVTEMTGTGLSIKFFESNSPDGTWTVEDLNGGVGFTYSMGIAYHQYDIELPSGNRRTDHSHSVIR